MKPWTTEVKQPYIITGGPGTNDPGRFYAPRVSMANLLTRAFDIQIDQIEGPAWLRDISPGNYFTVMAKIPAGATHEDFRKMLQNLLVDRFHLKFHIERRDFPGYELVVDKGGPKFSRVTASAEPGSGEPPDIHALMDAQKGDDGFPKLPGPRTLGMATRTGMIRTKYQERTIAEFVSTLGFTLGSSLGKPASSGARQPRVVDKTGLTGKYTFILEYYDAGMDNPGRNFPIAGSDSGNTPVPAVSDAGGGPTLFAAVPKQLGLRLDKVAAVPLDVIVVDSVDKAPTEN